MPGSEFHSTRYSNPGTEHRGIVHNGTGAKLSSACAGGVSTTTTGPRPPCHDSHSYAARYSGRGAGSGWCVPAPS